MEYNEDEAAAFRATRELSEGAMAAWRDVLTEHLYPHPRMRVLDVGSGTGAWASAFTQWFSVHVVAVDPSPAMSARSTYTPTIAGNAQALPLAADSMDAAWLSTVIHHIPDLNVAAQELRRVLRPGSPVLIRSAFPGRHHRIALFRYFPQAVAALERFPSVGQVRAAFQSFGFGFVTLISVPQVTAASLTAMVNGMSKDAHTPLKLISQDDYDAGLRRLDLAAKGTEGPVIDYLDLLVFEAPKST